MKLIKSIGIFSILLLFIFIFPQSIIFADLTETPSPSPTESITPTPTPDNTSQKLDEVKKKINELEGKISDTQSKEKTLSSQIDVIDNQIELTQLKINANKAEINELGKDIGTANKKITNLEGSLNKITKILLNRIVATYKLGNIPAAELLVSSKSFINYFEKTSLIRLAQENDKRLLYDTQQARNDYANQKNIYEEKKKRIEVLKVQLEVYNNQIAEEKKGKEELLKITKNDENNYQRLLAEARAEYEAIQGIVSGKGTESLVKDVKEGDSIASIISGSSPCSTGTHLHFEVEDNNINSNPANYLSSKDVTWDLCGWYGCDSQFSFTGSWQWPINNKPIITQGFGMTAYARSGAYGGGSHTGIDIFSDDLTVKAVKDGELYRGSIACGSGYLRYVKVKHNDGGIESYYLHVNYSY